MVMRTNEPNAPKPATAIGQAFQEAESQQGFKQTGVGGPNNTSQKKNSAMDIDSIISRPFGRQGVGETTQALADALTKRLKGGLSAQQRDMYDIQVMDRARTGAHFSSILVLKAVSARGVPVVAVYNYLVEASAQKLQARSFSQLSSLGSGPVVVPTAASDAINATLRQKTIDFIKGIFGQNAEVIYAAAQVLPTDLSASDDSAIGRIIYISTQALQTSLVDAGIIEEEYVDVKLLTNSGQNVAVLDTAPPEYRDSVGNPVRSDFNITLRNQTEQSQQNWDPNNSTVSDLTVVRGYVTVDYHVPEVLRGAGAYIPNVPPPTQRYKARVVLTSVDSLAAAVTRELGLLALATVPLIARNNAWMTLFRPVHASGKRGKNDINLRDITALGYETPVGGMTEPGRLPLPAGSDPSAFYQILAQLIDPTPLICMHVPEAGDETHLHHDLYTASLTPTSEESARLINEAAQRLFASANRLTNGRMSHNWDVSKRVAVAEEDRIALGTYPGGDGVRDVRDVDYVGMANLTGPKGDLPVLHEWSQTHDNVQVPLELRLQKRYQIDSEVMPGFQLKGWARPIILNPEWLAALTTSLREAGLLLQSSDALVDVAGQVIRGNYTTANMGLNYNQAGGNLFTSGQQGFGNYRGIGAADMTRFGR